MRDVDRYLWWKYYRIIIEKWWSIVSFSVEHVSDGDRPAHLWSMMKIDGDMQTEAEAMINEYLNALQDPYNGQVRHWLMKHPETSWELVILYHSDGEVVRDYFYEIEWVENGCTINLQPFLVEPMLYDSVESLNMYISRYHY